MSQEEVPPYSEELLNMLWSGTSSSRLCSIQKLKELQVTAKEKSHYRRDLLPLEEERWRASLQRCQVQEWERDQ